MSDKDRSFVIRAFVIALILWGSAMFVALLLGLYTPSVDNTEIFKILTPMSQQISAAVISIVSGIIGYRVGAAKVEQ